MTAPNRPKFGVYEVGRAYTDRRAAYAVVLGEAEMVAAVRGPSGHFWLPGGGSVPGESAEETLIREVREEVARDVRLIDRIGEATQYFNAANEDRQYRMQAVFFRAEFTVGLNTGADHELCWLPIQQTKTAFFHECHGWAVVQALRQFKQ